MSLFRNFAILRLHYGFPFAPIQILTGDTQKGCSSRHSRLHDDGRSLPPKSRIERRFESSPGVQRFANLWGTFGSFRTSEKNKSVLFAENIEVFQTSNQHTQNNKFALTKLDPFGTFRGFANLDSARRNGGFAPSPIKSFCRSAAFTPPSAALFLLLPQHFCRFAAASGRTKTELHHATPFRLPSASLKRQYSRSD